jgi:hypothetical protein
VECKNKRDASNNRGNWNHFKILQKILEQHTRKAQNQGTRENSYVGHSTHTAESANVEAQKSLILNTALYVPYLHPPPPLEDSLEVLGDDKCFVVVYFELAKIGIVLPFYFLPFTFLLLYIFLHFCIILYCLYCV